MIKKAMNKDKGSSAPGKEKIGSITKTQAEEIAKAKMDDLNTEDVEMARRIVEGAARSMGVEVTN
jgi:large subunit ribosomal protein L11